jgi:hypothetical protein
MGLAILARLFCWCEEICVWLDWRSECELRRWLMRGRQSAGKSACATCLEDFVFVVLSFVEAG